jgi:hypothetical protein
MFHEPGACSWDTDGVDVFVGFVVGCLEETGGDPSFGLPVTSSARPSTKHPRAPHRNHRCFQHELGRFRSREYRDTLVRMSYHPSRGREH